MTSPSPSMIPLEQAQELVRSHVSLLDVETVSLLDASGRIAAADLRSDMDVSPFAHAAMDGFALHAASIAQASEDTPVDLEVIAEVPAGGSFEGSIGKTQCVRIMTGAALPADADAVVKYELVDYQGGDGMPNSRVRFSAPTPVRSNIREAGEEAKEGEVVLRKGELIKSAGVGFLAGCGVMEVPVYRRPRVAIVSIGSELVPSSERPGPGCIRNSNGYALYACAREAGALPTMLPIVPDSMEALTATLKEACANFDFVVTSGGASDGDFDFIKPAIEALGTLYMTTVNIRPGKAQTFGVVEGTPVFGLAGNPAAAYIGFEMIVRPALLAMQGHSCLERPRLSARLTKDKKKKDPRRLLLRATLTRGEDGVLEVTPAANQSSGLFGVIQRSNCVAVLPEGEHTAHAGDMLDCILLDVAEGVVVS